MNRFPASSLPFALALALASFAFAEPPKPRGGAKLIVINDDGFSAFFSGRYQTAADLRAHVLTYRDTPLAVFEWCITSGSRTNFPAKSTELIGAGVTNFGRRGDRLAAETLRRLADQGTDTLQVVASACHETGLLCYATMRMNGDYAASAKDDSLSRQFNSDFWRAHPEFRVRGPQGEDKTKLSYAFPEVRAFKLALLREAAERDIDGIQLDFLRHPPFFGYEARLVKSFQEKFGTDPRPLPADDPRWFQLRADIMTGFLREVRQVLDEAGRKKGRHLGLSARIDWREHGAVGCDVATWLRENLLDYLAVGQHSLGGYEFDLAPFVALARGHGCAVLFAEEAMLSGHDRTAAEDKLIAAGEMVAPSRSSLTIEQYQSRAARWYAAGADGLHLFNESDPSILRGLASPTP